MTEPLPSKTPAPANAPAPGASVDHYENFPVASWLCPPVLRPVKGHDNPVEVYRLA